MVSVSSAVVVAMVAFPGPDSQRLEATGGPGWLPPEQPAEVTPTRTRVAAGLAVARRFLLTAVARRHVGDSWSLVTPALREGYTRREWAGGDIPVVPFPVDVARWNLEYAYADSLGFSVALFPPPKSQVRPTVFNLDLRAVGRGKNTRWLVEDFVPGAVRGLPAPTSGTRSRRTLIGADLAPGNRGEPRLGAVWLAVPFGVLALAVLVPTGFGLVRWQRARSVERAYARERAGL